MNKKNYLVYIAFGNDDFRNEAMSSILSYLLLKPQPDDATVLIYTDLPGHFKALETAPVPIVCNEIKPEQWKLWRGHIDFVHRIKIEVILHTILTYGGNTLYVDSDTYFLKSPAPVFEALAKGERFMHVYESTLKTSKGFHASVYENLKKYPEAEWYHTLSGASMYNAGVIGLSATEEPLLRKVLALTDTLYALHPTHVMEQLSFSMSMPIDGRLEQAAPYILHYWHMKDIRPVLSEFFKQHQGVSTAALVEAYAKLPVLEASRTKDKWELKKRWQRALMRIAGRGWKWPAH